MKATKALKKALRWTKNGTTVSVDWVIGGLEAGIDQVPMLAKKAVKATIEGDPHETVRKGKLADEFHASGALFSASNKRLTSFHLYPNGLIKFSKTEYGQASFDPNLVSQNSGSSQAGPSTQPETGESMQEIPAFRTDLSWRQGDQGYAEYWDGNTWNPGEWYEEQGLWTAFVNGKWYAWME